jgi:hypothetical protein
VQQALQYRKYKDRGLAGSGLRKAHYVPAFKHKWDSLLLDGGGPGKALRFYTLLYLAAKSEKFKTH